MKSLFSPLRLLFLSSLLVSMQGCMKTIPDDNSGANGSAIPTDIGFPLGDMESKTIGSSGGSVSSSDGKAELIIPSGALNSNTEISIQSISNNAPNGVGNAYRFLPEGTTFSQPVTLKFHYTPEDLAETLSDLMGIAFQDTAGFWHRLNNFTNDSAAKVISAPITHFSDWSGFDVMKITPGSAKVKINKTIGLEVVFVDAGKDGDELAPLFQSSAPIKWAINGIPDGNSSVGTIVGGGNNAVFTAPGRVPPNNPVLVSAELPIKTTYHGKAFNSLKLVSAINVVGGEKYLLEIKITDSTTSLIYTDAVSMTVVINSNDEVVVSNILNRAPDCTPSSARLASCTATWISDQTGETNITSVNGTISGAFGDPNRFLSLNFIHTGAVSPTFRQACDGADPVTDGGIPFSGLPAVAFFTLDPGKTVYEVSSPGELDKLTLVPD